MQKETTHEPSAETPGLTCTCGIVDCTVLRSKQLAAQGYSRTHVAEILGIERRKFYQLCSMMPDVEWWPHTTTKRARAGQAKRAARMRKGQ